MLSIIVAVAKNNAIGKGNNLLWHISQDLKYFKTVTFKHPVIMGRKTYESIGKPLPGRENIIITRKGGLVYPDIKDRTTTSFQVCNSIDEIVYKAKTSSDEYFVIGGGELYNEIFKYTDKLYITHIDAISENADTFFPEIKENDWNEISMTEPLFDEENKIYLKFAVYSRK